MSCSLGTTLPTPPTTLPACAVPVGGSNSSILDACCNGHINLLSTYAAPLSSSEPPENAEPSPNTISPNGCYQFCTTDSPIAVQNCLAQKLGTYRKDGSGLAWQCFNTEKVSGAEEARGEDQAEEGNGDYSGGGAYSNSASRGRVGWKVGVLVWVGVLGAIVSAA